MYRTPSRTCIVSALAAASVCIGTGRGARAAVPPTLHFQGVLAGPGGAPKPAGSYTLAFRLFDVPAGGAALWTEPALNVTTSSQGSFSADLGAKTPFGALTFDRPFYLEIQVAGDPAPLAPRLPLASAPYAIGAGSAVLSLPFSGSANAPSPASALSVTNTGAGAAIVGSSDNSAGTLGLSVNYDAASGYSTTGNGVRGGSTSNKGVFGTSRDNYGVLGASTNTFGAAGIAPAGGLYGEATTGYGAMAKDAAGSLAFLAGPLATGGHAGVYATAETYGVWGNTASGYAGVYGTGAHNGVYGQATSPDDSGVFGRNEAGGLGVFGFSVGGTGVLGRTDGDNQSGVFGFAWKNNQNGVLGVNSNAGNGVSGAVTGFGNGVVGTNGPTSSYGALGTYQPIPNLLNGAYGIGTYGRGDTGLSGYGHYSGINGPDGFSYGVYGFNDSPASTLGLGSGSGVTGVSVNGDGVFGQTQGSGAYGILGHGGTGVWARATGGGTALSAANYEGSGPGLAVVAPNGLWAVKISGNVSLSGNLFSTSTITASEKHFRIDHPLDPANKFLVHASVESDARRDLYDGSVTLDASGRAEVALPAWFEALNKDYRYQLTCIGGYAPVYIAEEIRENHFAIAGGTPGLKVCWQVTGVRHDAFAAAHPLDIEPNKPADLRGKYVSPEEYGHPATDSIAYEPPSPKP